MLDWLGVTIFVTRAKKEVMQEFRTSFKLDLETSAKVQAEAAVVAQSQKSSTSSPASMKQPARISLKPEPESESEPKKSLAKTESSQLLEDQPQSPRRVLPVAGFVSNRELRHSEIETKVKSWLYSRIIEGSLGDKETHIARFLNGCRNVLDDTSQRDKGLSVCYCGPSALSVTIQEAVEVCPGNTKIEFSADHM